MDKIEKVFIAGGTGFLGYPVAKLFLDRGAKVDTIALKNELPNLDFMDKRINLSFGNLFEMKDEEIAKLFTGKGYNAFVYALGPDDRVTPKAPAYEYFHEFLVEKCYNAIKLAKNAGVKKVAILGSYFAYFNKQLNGKLEKYHPYIRARVEQEERCLSLADDNFTVCILELPYIFGVGENRKPIWKDSFLKYFDGYKKVFFPKGGGTAIIERSGVAEAVYACLALGKTGTFPIASDNITYKEMLEIMLKSLNDNRKIVELPAFLCALGSKGLVKKHKREGKEAGLYYPKLMNGVLNKKFYIDVEKCKNNLNFSEFGFNCGKNAKEAIKTTMKSLA